MATALRDLKERTRKFAVRIVKLCRRLPKTMEGKVIGSQLLRCGTSVGAEETDEVVFWLELLIDTGMFSQQQLQELLPEANELVAIFVSSQQTVTKSPVIAGA